MLLKWTEFRFNKIANLLSLSLQLVHVDGAIASMLTGTVVVGGEKKQCYCSRHAPSSRGEARGHSCLEIGKKLYLGLGFLASVFISSCISLTLLLPAIYSCNKTNQKKKLILKKKKLNKKKSSRANNGVLGGLSCSAVVWLVLFHLSHIAPHGPSPSSLLRLILV